MTATAIMAALNYDIKVLMTQAHFTMNNLEAPLLGLMDIRQKDDMLSQIGLQALLKEMKVAPVNYETVKNCSVSLIPNRLSLLPGNFVGHIDIFRRDMCELIERALYVLNEFYDYIFVDTPSGSNYLSEQILSVSDVIVINLSQNRTSLNQFFKEYDLSLYSKKSIFYIIGDYDARSKYNYSYLLSQYPNFHKKNLAVIPYSTGYRDALMDAAPIPFFESMNWKGMEVTDKEYPFFYAMNQLIHKLFRMLGERRRL